MQTTTGVILVKLATAARGSHKMDAAFSIQIKQTTAKLTSFPVSLAVVCLINKATQTFGSVYKIIATTYSQPAVCNSSSLNLCVLRVSAAVKLSWLAFFLTNT